MRLEDDAHRLAGTRVVTPYLINRLARKEKSECFFTALFEKTQWESKWETPCENKTRW